MDILKISESELCDLIIAKHRKARDSLETEVNLLQKAALLYEKHDQLKHRAQMCEEECEANDKVNKYLEEEKKVSEELSRVRNSLKSKGHLTNIEVQKKTSTLKQSIEEQDKTLAYWQDTKHKLVKEKSKEENKKPSPKKEKAKTKKPAKKKATSSKKKPATKKKKPKK